MRDWELASAGLSGDVVRRSPDGSAYSKTAHGEHRRLLLMAERDRVACRVPGVPAPDVARDRASEAILGIARILGELHALPLSGSRSTSGSRDGDRHRDLALVARSISSPHINRGSADARQPKCST